MTNDERGAIGLAALERGREGIEAQAAFDLRALVAAEAARLENGLHVAIEIDAAFFNGAYSAATVAIRSAMKWSIAFVAGKSGRSEGTATSGVAASHA